jgi:hypothetical protein
MYRWRFAGGSSIAKRDDDAGMVDGELCRCWGGGRRQ